MKACRFCAEQIEDDASACPHCEEPLHSGTPAPRREEEDSAAGRAGQALEQAKEPLPAQRMDAATGEVDPLLAQERSLGPATPQPTLESPPPLDPNPKTVVAWLAVIIVAIAVIGALGSKNPPPETAKPAVEVENRAETEARARFAEQWKIVPGRSYGPIHLGMPVDAARKKIGEFFNSCNLHDGMGASSMLECTHSRFFSEDPACDFFMWVHLSGDTVAAIYVSKVLNGAIPGRTSEGVGYGSSTAEIKKALGEPDDAVAEILSVEEGIASPKILFYDKRGISFRFRPGADEVDSVLIGERRWWGDIYRH